MAKIPKIEQKSKQLDITIEKGATFLLSFVWKVGKLLLPKDLTDYTARMHIREDADSEIVLHSATTENAGISIISSEGRINILITDDDSTLFNWNDAVYDLELIDSAGEGTVYRLLYGDVLALDEVTR